MGREGKTELGSLSLRVLSSFLQGREVLYFMGSSHLAIDEVKVFRNQGNPSGLLEIEPKCHTRLLTSFALITSLPSTV